MATTGEHTKIIELFSLECAIKDDHAACSPVMTELGIRCACDCHKAPAETDLHTCARGPVCGEMAAALDAEETAGGITPCGHPSCQGIAYGWVCAGCEADEATAAAPYDAWSAVGGGWDAFTDNLG